MTPPATTPFSLKDLTLKDTLWYTAAAGAALALGSSAATAQILYTDIDDVTITSDDEAGEDAEFFLDFDGDGDPEMRLFEDFEGANGPRSYLIAFNSRADADGNPQPDSLLGYIANTFPFNGNPYAYFLPLEEGDFIDDSELSFSFQDAATFGIATFTYASLDPNSWIDPDADQYFGVKIAVTTDDVETQHFAWVRVSVPEEGVLIVKDYAVELTPEEGIVAGATGVSNEADEALTGSHRISAVYPNPFADQASLNLEVARSQDVDIAVYNLLGQRVATLANETLAAGEVHEFELNGRNLPSGLYVIRARGAEFSDTVRVTVAH